LARRAKTREQRANTKQQTAERREKRSESRQQRAEIREQRAYSRDQRADSRDKRAENTLQRGSTAESGNHTFGLCMSGLVGGLKTGILLGVVGRGSGTLPPLAGEGPRDPCID
jgi:hypothetical protein